MSVDANPVTDAQAAASARAPGFDDAALNDVKRLRLTLTKNPFLALGLAVDHLMNKPAYGALKFAAWSKILAGQINRGHYRFVMDRQDRVVGMLGWTYVDQAFAESWVHGRPTDAGIGTGGNCVIFNLWSAEDPDATELLLDAARRAVQGRETLYFRRFYEDGRVRPVRLSVTAFIADHVKRRSARSGRPSNMDSEA